MGDLADKIKVRRDSGSDTLHCAACGCSGTHLLVDAPFEPYAFVLHDECAAQFATAVLAALPAPEREAVIREASQAAGLRVLKVQHAKIVAHFVSAFCGLEAVKKAGITPYATAQEFELARDRLGRLTREAWDDLYGRGETESEEAVGNG